MSGLRAISEGLVSCHTCHKLVPVDSHRCPCCGSALHLRKSNSLQRTLALLLTACVLYVPANVFPIMYTDQFGNTIESTIIGGVVILIEMGSWPVALVIFCASVMVPIGKLIMLFYLCWVASRGVMVNRKQLTRAYRITELIGKWSMVDVFVVFVLVALINLGQMLVMRPGIAAMSFAGLVMVTMLAAESFDPRVLWDQEEKNHE